MQAGGQRFDPAQLHQFGVELAERYPWRNKSLHRLDEVDACSDYIVKRRYVWKLPGVEDDRKVVGDVRAQSL